MKHQSENKCPGCKVAAWESEAAWFSVRKVMGTTSPLPDPRVFSPTACVHRVLHSGLRLEPRGKESGGRLASAGPNRRLWVWEGQVGKLPLEGKAASPSI